MILNDRVNFIRKISLGLFLFSLLSLIGSLFVQNTIASFKFTKNLYDEKIEISQIFKENINCSENLEKCKNDPSFGFFKVADKLEHCFTYKHENYYTSENNVVDHRKFLFEKNQLNENSMLKPQYRNKEIEVQFKFTNQKNPGCIKNSNSYKFYKIIPSYYEFLYYLKNISLLGSNDPINPFIYGEASISNIVKRFPINLVFKPLLYISVILMFLYWRSYNYLFDEILNSRNEKFVFFGIASAVLLFFHVLFLGMEIDNKIFKLLRKIIIVLFILSEIIAQFLLTINLYKNKENLKNYCNVFIINLKMFFVITIFSVSMFVIFILLFYDLSSKVDYILEWNYFAGLLFYYLLSALMWKKLTSNPASS